MATKTAAECFKNNMLMNEADFVPRSGIRNIQQQTIHERAKMFSHKLRENLYFFEKISMSKFLFMWKNWNYWRSSLKVLV